MNSNITLNKRKTLLATFVAMFAAGATTQGAMAQTESATEQSRIDEIVVTASKRETSLQDTALSVSAISGADLDKLGVTSFDQIMATVPGVTLLELGPGSSAIVFRGITTSSFGNANSAASSTYIDEFPLALRDIDIKLVDMAQIEVLKGPQGTLYGQSALGGVTRYITNRPDFEKVSGGVGLTGENVADGDEGYQAQGYINIPLSDNLAARAVFYNYDRPGFIDNLGTNTENINSEETTGGRLALRWAISDRAEFNLLYLNQSQRVNSGQGNGIQAIASTYTPTNANFPATPTDIRPPDLENPTFRSNINPFFEREFEALNLKLDVDFKYFDLSIMGARKERKSHIKSDVSLWIGIYDDVTTTLENIRSDFDATTFEARLVSTGDGPIEWLAGVWYENEKGDLRTSDILQTPRTDLVIFGFLPGIDGAVLTDSERFDDQKELAVYGEVSYRFTDKAKLTLGYRRADLELDSGVLRADGPFAGGLRNAIGVPEDAQEDINTYKVNIEYAFNDNILTYVLASSGYRAGGFNRGGIGSVTANSAYESDSLWDYELGIRTAWMENRLTANAAAYYIDWSDIQLRSWDVTTASQRIQNAGTAEIFGLETEIRYQATDSLHLSLNYAYTDASLTEDLLGAGGIVDAKDGDTLPGSSKNTFSLLVDWQMALTEDLDLQTNASYVYTSSRAPSLLTGDLTSGFPDVPSSDVVNLSAAIKHNNGISVSLFANNLLDDRNIQYQARLGTALESAIMNRPRTIGLRVGYTF